MKNFFLFFFIKKIEKIDLFLFFSNILSLIRVMLFIENINIFSIMIFVLLIVQLIFLFYRSKLKNKKYENAILTNSILIILTLLSYYFSIFYLKKPIIDLFDGVEIGLIFYHGLLFMESSILKIFIILLFYIFSLFNNPLIMNEKSFLIYYSFFTLLIIFIMIVYSKKKISSKKNNLNLIDNEVKIKKENEENLLSLNILNSMNECVILINKEFNIKYANTCSFNLFNTDNFEKINERLLQLKEDKDYIELSEFKNIPDLKMEKFFKSIKNVNFDSTLKQETLSPLMKSNSLIDFMTLKTLKTKLVQNSFNSNSYNGISDFTQLEAKWKKYCLNYNGEFFNIEKKKKDLSLEDNNIKSYLAKIFKTYPKCLKTSFFIQNKMSSHLDIEKYSMYTKFISNEGEIFTLLINFVPIHNDLLHKDVLLILRKLTDLEMEYGVNNAKSKTRILGSFCHELRTPLNGLINMLDMIQSTLEEKEIASLNVSVNEFIANAVVSSNLLLYTINDFIDYFSLCNNMFELDLKEFDLILLLHEIYRIFSYMAKKKNLNFNLEIEKTIPTYIKNDSKKIAQIIFNLLNNSIRFTEQGSIELRAEYKKNSIYISVLDTGCGIPEEELQYLASIEEELGNQKKTTVGFGLFISNHLANQIGAYDSEKDNGIIVYTKEKEGTKFTIEIKNYLEDNSKTYNNLYSSDDNNNDPSINYLNNIKNEFDEKNKITYKFIPNKEMCNCSKVLIVDDGVFNVESCKTLLEKLKIGSDKAFNGQEAIDKIKRILEKKEYFCKNCKFFKIILMDIDMPIKNGFEATEEIIELTKQYNKNISIIGLSAFDSIEMRNKGLKAGMKDYYFKPISFAQMKEIINLYIQN